MHPRPAQDRSEGGRYLRQRYDDHRRAQRMSTFWMVSNWNDLPSNARVEYRGDGLKVRIRGDSRLKDHFDEMSLEYLDEKIIDYLADSLQVASLGASQHRERFHDFSFLTAPAYKAFEGYLFQIARDLDL